MAKIRYCCVGAGGIARKKHVSGYSKQKDVEIVAICDECEPSARALAKDFCVEKIYTDYKKMLEECKPDLVSVCTCNCSHAEIAIAALRAGANVHIEKPIAMNAKEAKEIVKAAEETGKQVMVGLNKRFQGQTFLIRELIEKGFFGHIYKVNCGWERSSGIPGVGRWFTNKKLSGGGCLIDLGVHYLDLAMSFLGWPEIESVSNDSFNNHGGLESERIRRGYKSDKNGVYDVEDYSSGNIRLKEGCVVEYTFSWASNVAKEIRYVKIHGTKGSLSMVDDKIELYSQIAGTMFTSIADEATLPNDMDECGHFVDCIVNNKKVLVPAEEGLKMMEIIDFLYKSTDEKKRDSIINTSKSEKNMAI